MIARLTSLAAVAALALFSLTTNANATASASAPAAPSFAAWFTGAAPAAVSALDVYATDYGKCSFDSDCHKGVKCNSSHCADSAGSSCSFDSDCGGNGAKCNSSKCSNAPDGKCSFSSECPGGSCSSGKCKF